MSLLEKNRKKGLYLKITNGSATKRLFKIIPEKDVQIILDAYEKLKDIQPQSFPPGMPINELCNIALELKRLKHHGYITQDERLKIFKYVKDNVENARHGISESNSIFSGQLKIGKRGAPKKYALDILCSALIFVVHAKVGRSSKINNLQRKLVGDVLQEQGIVKATYFETLRKGRRDNEFEDIMKELNALGSTRKGDFPLVWEIRDANTHLYGLSHFRELSSCLSKYNRLVTSYLKNKQKRRALL